MTKDEFFEELRRKTDSNKAFIIEVLKLRGFLFDDSSDELILSDNSYSSDSKYLYKLFEKYNLGKMVDGRIEINDADCAAFIQEEFRENNQIVSESCSRNYGWSYFKRREHGHKVAVSWLEPFIARYIKAISACCVLTVGSCDGNHPQRDKMLIMTEGMGSIPWHKLICEKCLVGKYDINWINDCTAIKFSPNTKYDTYYEVNKAAEYLYSNRKEIRRIKAAVFQGLSDSYLKHHSSDEIEKEFVGRASELFDSSYLSDC